MAIDPRSARPAYQQLSALLRDRINTGDYPPGEKLPSEAEMVDEHGVSRDVVRRALAALRAEGLVSSAQGRGTFVRPHRVVRRRASSHYLDEHAQLARAEADRDDVPFTHGHDYQHWQLGAHAAEVPADEDMAEAFGVDLYTPLLRRTFTFVFDLEPHRRSLSYLPMDLVRGTPITDAHNEPWPGGTMAQLHSVGVTVDAVEEVVSARMPELDERDELHIDEGVPVVCIRRLMLSGERVVEVCDIVIPADRVDLQYRMELGRAEEA
jgi:GntR family transcriptional regulator